jgi:hypothetical protein
MNNVNKLIDNNSSDLFKKYIHDIRNVKTLDEEMINNVCNMSNKEKIAIIMAFNDVVEYIKRFIE